MKRIASFFLAAVCAAQAQESKSITTRSGLRYEVLRAGKAGTNPTAGDTVRVHYTGWFEDGKQFDSSRDRGKPFELMVGVGAVIPGWDEGLALMTEGSQFKFHIPWRLAYGERGGRGIPPKANLVFEVELLSVKKGEPIPKFRPLDPARLKTSASGFRYEVVREGEGQPPRADQSVKLKFALWNKQGRMIMCTQASKIYIAGLCATLKLGPVEQKFLQEAPLLLKPGGAARFEVPPNLCWGARPVHPALPANSVTIWHLELVKVIDLPVFRKSDPSRIKKTDSGLMYEVIKAGTGKRPTISDKVKVHYTGWLESGKMFDSSHARDQPAVFGLRGVIRGWTEGLQLMKEGAIYRFTIPGELAYGPNPQPGSGIPPNATLIFLVELIKVGG